LLPAGFTAERSWRLHRHPVRGTVPLFECRVGGHNMLSLDPGCEGANQQPLGPVGHIFIAPMPGWAPIYRCRVLANGDHFISADPNCEGQIKEGQLGYAKD
jgi:hypothetical protein